MGRCGERHFLQRAAASSSPLSPNQSARRFFSESLSDSFRSAEPRGTLSVWLTCGALGGERSGLSGAGGPLTNARDPEAGCGAGTAITSLFPYVKCPADKTCTPPTPRRKVTRPSSTWRRATLQRERCQRALVTGHKAPSATIRGIIKERTASPAAMPAAVLVNGPMTAAPNSSVPTELPVSATPSLKSVAAK